MVHINNKNVKHDELNFNVETAKERYHCFLFLPSTFIEIKLQ